jgi:hypothetical protein
MLSTEHLSRRMPRLRMDGNQHRAPLPEDPLPRKEVARQSEELEEDVQSREIPWARQRRQNKLESIAFV